MTITRIFIIFEAKFNSNSLCLLHHYEEKT
nr:MAG TPA: hypothetical protein [Caudoviricetes sp.]